MYTQNGGTALGHPAVGSLEPGSVADLVVSRAPNLGIAVAVGARHVARVYRDGNRLPTRTSSGER
jgi:imidazolonepropionase-like amidohydrolase